MATTVYVVTQGEYSDYHIKGVFSTEEKAKEFMANKKKGDTIDSWILDEREDYCDRQAWLCVLRESGDVHWQGMDTEFASPSTRGYVEKEEYDGQQIFRATSYESAQHALKLATECRQAWLRKQTELKP
jgi:hypothetical protein